MLSWMQLDCRQVAVAPQAVLQLRWPTNGEILDGAVTRSWHTDGITHI
jgi:hypothetical protein